jgi:hypothetical protein
MTSGPSRGASQRLERRPEPASSSGHLWRSCTSAWGGSAVRLADPVGGRSRKHLSLRHAVHEEFWAALRSSAGYARRCGGQVKMNPGKVRSNVRIPFFKAMAA